MSEATDPPAPMPANVVIDATAVDPGISPRNASMVVETIAPEANRVWATRARTFGHMAHTLLSYGFPTATWVQFCVTDPADVPPVCCTDTVYCCDTTSPGMSFHEADNGTGEFAATLYVTVAPT